MTLDSLASLDFSAFSDALTQALRGIWNWPDLILIVFLYASVSLGAQRGFLRTLIALFGRLFSLFAAAFLARVCAPIVAESIVGPLVGDIFARQVRAYAQTNASAPFLDQAQQQVTQTAAQMAEGVAYLILLAVFLCALSVVLRALSIGARMITRIGPIGFLNRAAGAVLGLLSGVLLALLLLWLVHLIRPELFQPLGCLSPEAIAQTTVLRTLLHYFPII